MCGNLVSPKSTFFPFYSCFIRYFPCITFHSKTQKRKKGVLNVGRAGVVAMACISAAGASTSTKAGALTILFESTQINIARKPYKKIPRTQSKFSSKQFSLWCFFFCNKSVTYIHTSAKWYFPKKQFLLNRYFHYIEFNCVYMSLYVTFPQKKTFELLFHLNYHFFIKKRCFSLQTVKWHSRKAINACGRARRWSQALVLLEELHRFRVADATSAAWWNRVAPGILSTTFRLQPEVNSTISACSRHGSDVDSIHDFTSTIVCLSRAANWEVALALLDWHVRTSAGPYSVARRPCMWHHHA